MRSILYRSTMLAAIIAASLVSFATTHVLTPTPNSISFGAQSVGTSTAQPLTITNTGTGSVQVQAVTVSGATVFQVSGFTNAVTLRPSQALQLSVTFAPTSAVSYTATLAITANGGASISVPLNGSGTGSSSSVVVTISPTTATVPVGRTQQFTATVTGTTDTSVTWLVNGTAGGNSTVGTISTTGLYTAPGTEPSGGTVTVTAQSVADSTQSANASVTITTVYANIDDSTTLDSGGSAYGWGWCGDPSCSGGTTTATQQIYWGQQPSLDSGSMEFLISGSNWADGLWWYKIGPNTVASNFQYDFWLNVSQQTVSYAQALEFDSFQFISPTEYMFGTQCNYSQGYNRGVWDVWSQGGGSWNHTGVACPGFVAGDWYHITWNFSRTSDRYEHYNSVAVAHFDSTGTTQLDSTTTQLNITMPSGPLPSGWNNTMGVQFQLDINGAPGPTGTATYSIFVDKVSLTVW